MNGASTARGILLGVLAAIVTAIVYGVLSEPFEFSLGLLVIGFVGGWLIGNAVAYGSWSGREHETITALRWTAVALAVVAWVGALFLAFVISQALLPQAVTPLSERVTVGGFVDYFLGLDIVRFIHVIALALMALMAWRGAR
ncbi:MAG TPA: hypothetical protein VIK00_03190 [Candidatus Limnocylindrales bacterium]